MNQATDLTLPGLVHDLNNVFQTVLPVKGGKFNQVSMQFDIASGIVNFDRILQA